VPIRYDVVNGEKTPIYHSPGPTPAFDLPRESWLVAFDELAQANSDVADIAIDAAYLRILTLDQNLTRYYISTSKEIDNFSIKVDGTDYSNVEGAFGVFGSTGLTEYKISINEQFARSLGFSIYDIE
jgi:hypothetical protein